MPLPAWSFPRVRVPTPPLILVTFGWPGTPYSVRRTTRHRLVATVRTAPGGRRERACVDLVL
jgi:hypothetical protein